MNFVSIENEINQRKFNSEQQKATINLIYTFNWVREKISEILATEDITSQQFNILRILRGSHPKPLSTLQIRERMLDKMSDTSRLVDRLLAKELVKKGTCDKDRRLVDVSISDKGLRMLERLDKKQHELDSVLGNLSNEEAAELSSLLDKIREKN